MEKLFMKLFRTFLVVVLFGNAAAAEGLAAPKGDILLTVTGDIGQHNAGEAAQFDRAMLMKLGTREVVTHTIWTEGPQSFVGVPLKTFAMALGIKDGTIAATAVNDYSVNIPWSDVEEDFALLALDRNGEPMTVRDKGPIWLIFPYDDDPRFRQETYHARSIWQLQRIDIKR
ncbi:molybdopterin-dependent oxidoreductase [Sagittula salina]|uniref:molybdopterin-dependent oxidoreductase n=1 Tax=Sagittula salina TaxID=2820268 RepID=UPI001FD82767|nr:molybdopterin-dependent oxidoreductase [Sagittula salina]